jgi:hypothetical protein
VVPGLRRCHACKLGVPTFAVRTGGFSDTELCGARAIAVYDSLSGLQADLAGSSPATDQGSANPETNVRLRRSSGLKC